MRFFMALFFALNCCVSSVWAQTVNNEAKHQQRVAEMENNPVVKYSRSFLPTNQDQKTARNLMIVKEVVNFKMGDENLAKIVFTNHFYNLFYALRVEFIEYIVKFIYGNPLFFR